ncbi:MULTISPECIES: N-6 DNA methylase [unclassified Mesorhizobium]|uniref:Eco57I restriction-modification methylase domain-containing protein n=1 Tax=unclassified Mesorhizobium TaxID=325217 RepID=UPI001651A2C5|nr:MULTISPECIES: N-6 DNA methylase [unclassified Mesorhizobium]
MFTPRDGVAASAVFLVGDAPVACLLDAAELPVEIGPRQLTLRRFCERLWNQNLVSVVLLLGAASVEAYSVIDSDALPEVFPAAQATKEGAWSSADFLSGRVWERNDTWFDAKLRVDKKLLDNIAALVDALRGYDVRPNAARDAVARVIFVSYLQHRGIVGERYREKYGVRDLSELMAANDRHGLETLFRRLKDDFNGDFLDQSSDGTTALWNLPETCLAELSHFLRQTDLRSGQTSFWKYDFGEIPIELISGIYETFLATKDQDTPDAGDGRRQRTKLLTKRELGAFYTPRRLAAYVVDQAFQGVSDPLAQTVFDGACGSGILLTTAYRRLIRAAEERKGAPLTFEQRRELACERIFGSDIDLDACRLTAFSLYLAMLSDLQPADLASIQEHGGKLPHLIGANIRDGKPNGDLFSPAGVRSTQGRYSLFISNPPWREPAHGEDTSYERWLSSLSPMPHVPLRQIAAAFTFRAIDCVKEGGRLSLILPASLFVGRIGTSFRADLLAWMRIDQIVNFSDMRRLIFPGAKHPFVVVTGYARAERYAVPRGEFLDYLIPKADISLAYGRLTVHGDDRVRLPTGSIAEVEPILGLRYWGTDHDISLLRRLARFGSVGDLTETRHTREGKWRVNSGFLAEYKDSPAHDPGELRDFPFLDARNIPADCVLLDETRLLRPFPQEEFPAIAYFGEWGLYDGPRVLWPDGADPEAGIKAVYTERRFCFRHGVKAIGGRSEDSALMKLLAAYLRSPLANYFLILLSHSVSGERPKLHINELKAMPFVRPEQHPVPEMARAVLASVDNIFAKIGDVEEGFRDAAYAQLKPSLDKLVFSYFQLSNDDEALVMEMVKKIAPSIQPASTQRADLLTALLFHPTRDDLEKYRSTLERCLTEWRQATGGSGDINVRVQFNKHRLIAAAEISIGLPRSSGSASEGKIEEDLTGALLDAVDASVRSAPNREGAQILAMPNITIAAGKSIRLVKPFRNRFWLRRAAMDDADRIVEQIQTNYVRRVQAS